MIGFGVSVLLIMKVVVPADWDPSAVASFGIEEQSTLEYASSRLDRVVARPSIGHDGRFFFVQANDPFLLQPQENAWLLDRPTYRTQRMFYPLLAGMGGLLSPSYILWGLIGVNVAATGLGTLAVAAYAVQHGLSR
jgi:hypothetical protein